MGDAPLRMRTLQQGVFAFQPGDSLVMPASAMGFTLGISSTALNPQPTQSPLRQQPHQLAQRTQCCPRSRLLKVLLIAPQIINIPPGCILDCLRLRREAKPKMGDASSVELLQIFFWVWPPQGAHSSTCLLSTVYTHTHYMRLCSQAFGAQGQSCLALRHNDSLQRIAR